MIELDTNVLVRLLVDDEGAPAQVAQARARVAGEQAVAVGSSVFLETMWVLERSYRLPRKEVLRVANLLLGQPRFHFAEREWLLAAVECLREGNIGFGDALALAHARGSGNTLLTFDRKLGRCAGVEWLEA